MRLHVVSWWRPATQVFCPIRPKLTLSSSGSAQSVPSSPIIYGSPIPMYPSPSLSAQRVATHPHSCILEGRKRVKLSSYQSHEVDRLQQASGSTKRYIKPDRQSSRILRTRINIMDQSGHSSSVSRLPIHCRHCHNSNIVSPQTRSSHCSKMDWASMTSYAPRYGLNLPPDHSLYLEPRHMVSRHRKQRVRSRICRDRGKGISSGELFPILDKRLIWSHGSMVEESLIRRSSLHPNLHRYHYPLLTLRRRQRQRTYRMSVLHCRPYSPSPASDPPYSPCHISTTPYFSNSRLTPISTR